MNATSSPAKEKLSALLCSCLQDRGLSPSLQQDVELVDWWLKPVQTGAVFLALRSLSEIWKVTFPRSRRPYTRQLDGISRSSAPGRAE